MRWMIADVRSNLVPAIVIFLGFLTLSLSSSTDAVAVARSFYFSVFVAIYGAGIYDSVRSARRQDLPLQWLLDFRLLMMSLGMLPKQGLAYYIGGGLIAANLPNTVEAVELSDGATLIVLLLGAAILVPVVLRGLDLIRGYK